MMAATRRMMRVTSRRASQASLKKLLGGRGGIVFDPNKSLLRSRSSLPPLSPEWRGIEIME
jgi:hypothetical protein